MTTASLPSLLSEATMCCTNIRSAFLPLSGMKCVNRSLNFMLSVL